MTDSYTTPRTLMDAAAFQYHVRIACHRCGRVRIWEAHRLWWWFERKGWPDRLDQLGQHIFCGQCWRQRCAKIRPADISVCRHPADPCPLPMPNERVWKQALSRYRR